MGTERARSAGRAFEVLRALARSRGPMTAQALADSCRIPRSSSYQLLGVMREHRLVEYNADERSWSLGIGVLELGAAYQRSGGLQQRSAPQLAGLTTATGHTSHLAVLDGDEVVYLAKREPAAGGIRLVTEVGTRLPASRTAVGKAILAQLPAQELAAVHGPQSAGAPEERFGFQELVRDLHQVRDRGYAVDDGQITPGITCVAAPVLGADGVVIAAVGVSYVGVAQDDVGQQATINAVRHAARELSATFAPVQSVDADSTESAIVQEDHEPTVPAPTPHT
ncbi:IclR family transcriptional regulator [Microlunatus soli]|uniref:DNA-binding transcriptional regulator, IclR family n=1 Tax=Microlunatus soli TaxID=630515 RepID=A0A1H1RTT5_9ACTN|nr:IclR family transcriptional regulator [Microlunatus soli]SDS39075.1 DNA-binding transcriptional regulator, IclR family [Microlunatus soli]